MEEMVTAVRTVCVLCIGICAVQSMTEGTRLKSQAGMVMKLILAVIIGSVIMKGGREFSLPDLGGSSNMSYEHDKEIYDEEIIRQTEKNISDVLTAQVRSAGINVEKIAADVNIPQNGSIVINRVFINTSDNDSAADIIRGSLGQETEVVDEDA